jgi:hypothetical protein
MIRIPGSFSSNLLSVQLQLGTLLEGIGGESATKFLDSVSKLSASEQGLILSALGRVVEKIANGEERLYSNDDVALKNFEEGLYQDLVAAIKASNGGQEDTRRSSAALKVVRGSGKYDFRPSGRSKARPTLRLSTAMTINGEDDSTPAA